MQAIKQNSASLQFLKRHPCSIASQHQKSLSFLSNLILIILPQAFSHQLWAAIFLIFIMEMTNGNAEFRSKIVARRGWTRSICKFFTQLWCVVSSWRTLFQPVQPTDRPYWDWTSWNTTPRTPSKWRIPFNGIRTLSSNFKRHFVGLKEMTLGIYAFSRLNLCIACGKNDQN